MISVTGSGLAKAQAEIAHIKGGLDKAISRASKRVAMQGRTEISKGIRQNLNVKAADLKKVLEIGKGKKGASITLRESQRFSLRYFGATQNAKGVSYRINKGSGRSFIEGAFQGPKPGAMKASWRGNVFKRVGKSRLPIQKLMGASAWGSFVVKGMYKPTERSLQQKFENRLQHEINYLITQAKQKSG